MSEALATHDDTPPKRRAALQLEGWSITLGLQGYGAADGSGWIAIEQDGVLDPIREFDDDGRPDDFWMLNLDAGDFTAVRDWLNRQLPPSPSLAERDGVREALLSSVLLEALKRLMAAERAASDAVHKGPVATEITAAWSQARAAVAQAEAG